MLVLFHSQKHIHKFPLSSIWWNDRCNYTSSKIIHTINNNNNNNKNKNNEYLVFNQPPSLLPKSSKTLEYCDINIVELLLLFGRLKIIANLNVKIKNTNESACSSYTSTTMDHDFFMFGGLLPLSRIRLERYFYSRWESMILNMSWISGKCLDSRAWLSSQL